MAKNKKISSINMAIVTFLGSVSLATAVMWTGHKTRQIQDKNNNPENRTEIENNDKNYETQIKINNEKIIQLLNKIKDMTNQINELKLLKNSSDSKNQEIIKKLEAERKDLEKYNNQLVKQNSYFEKEIEKLNKKPKTSTIETQTGEIEKPKVEEPKVEDLNKLSRKEKDNVVLNQESNTSGAIVEIENPIIEIEIDDTVNSDDTKNLNTLNKDHRDKVVLNNGYVHKEDEVIISDWDERKYLSEKAQKEAVAEIDINFDSLPGSNKKIHTYDELRHLAKMDNIKIDNKTNQQEIVTIDSELTEEEKEYESMLIEARKQYLLERYFEKINRIYNEFNWYNLEPWEVEYIESLKKLNLKSKEEYLKENPDSNDENHDEHNGVSEEES
ncbi:hypothetical protein [Mycoplasma sp. OR1901]|uniref:hypothetical protein n=1 Tax=Mycoplasma sp. OR1901 TaxID=2742195 RepID=UPI0015838256|nr:hypothetical protein [Mycoplasma sp. OR1901]QKT05487.1 hypothetical protein HTZ87_02095 [Mycoplasma sp. OR1901]